MSAPKTVCEAGGAEALVRERRHLAMRLAAGYPVLLHGPSRAQLAIGAMLDLDRCGRLWKNTWVAVTWAEILEAGAESWAVINASELLLIYGFPADLDSIDPAVESQLFLTAVQNSSRSPRRPRQVQG